MSRRIRDEETLLVNRFDGFFVGPPASKAMIADSRWSDWERTEWVNPKGLQSAKACAFAVVKNGSQNDLLAFGWDSNGWKYKWHNASAFPQVEAPVLLGLSTQGKKTAFASFYVLNEEIMEDFCVWVQKRDGTWHLDKLLHYIIHLCFLIHRLNEYF